jgi:hypothetical protein
MIVRQQESVVMTYESVDNAFSSIYLFFTKDEVRMIASCLPIIT